MNESLWRDIRQSGYLHRPLPLYGDRSLEQEQARETILHAAALFPTAIEEASVAGLIWEHRGAGTLSATSEGLPLLGSPTVMPAWPIGAPADGDYTNFGNAWIAASLERANWESFNRMTLELRPDFQGVPNAYVMIQFRNEGAIPIPDLYEREGVHGVNLRNQEWNTIHLNIQELPRDAITEIAIGYMINGKERATGDTMELRLRSITLEQVPVSSVSKGWLPSAGTIIYSQSGYSLHGTKTAFASELAAAAFHLKRDGEEEIAYSGDIRMIETALGSFALLDFTPFKQEGRYYLQAGDVRTESFTIGAASSVWHASLWKALNFVFCERCGYPVPGIHGACHADITASHEGSMISFNGGWHDAGDVSQQLIQSAEVTAALFEMAEQVKAQDEDLYLRLLEEGEWGIDFLLKTRFGDGYRATSAGMTRWTDGRIGGMDDAVARVHNQAYENFYCAGIQADISRKLPNAALSTRLLEAAKEDFDFALEEYGKHGFGQKPTFWEHTYQTSESLYMATASWAATMLYNTTKEERYAKHAASFIAYVQRSQELDGILLDDGTAMRGFLYRNPDKRVVQHFNHQAREHLYMQALVAIHQSQPEHTEADSWLASIQAYGEYVKKLAAYTAPYPMLASGLYHIDEHLDSRSFNLQHLLIDEQALADYSLQLQAGVRLNASFYLRRFPVWFSFRGNNAILLSAGKAASAAGAYLNDQELLDIAEGQLRWIVGCNPFGQSLMHGEGYRYAQQYSVLSGEMTGELPVGVQTFGNEDEPYWPQFNNATYKEVWTGNAGKWLSLAADLYAVDARR
ncbi:glycoside hydrolase family 9 protein [Paenibacillus sp. MMS18-CY102]|uniref:glycoside hydrolase family 9 protein n=1 Tax=Paenibacillus sp. MMS18-CY102 TaxID=2682849 RepID=UPI0013654DA0|nr:endoglucanase [Paenibacillus sp. MMS18-CY102]